VRDVAFHVDDATGIYNKAVSRGAKGIQEPTELKDEHGSVIGPVFKHMETHFIHL